jgi:16S rRNA (cytidine1402-2'-O)-methyltransferase
MSNQSHNNSDVTGALYVLATPIGNLGDISRRALDILNSVSVVLAEGTRHSKRLFNHYGITTKLRACHQHNEEKLVDWVVQCLAAGENIALISDAGTPLISDPGFVLVRALRAQGCEIVAVPGPSSIIAALSIAGLPTDSFVFDGFLAAKHAARCTQLARYQAEPRTIVLLESSHRIVACLQDIVEVLGGSRRCVIARELTKKFESVLNGTAAEILTALLIDENQTRGEFVLMLAGAKEVSQDQADTQAMLKILMAELPLKQASMLAAKLSGERKNDIYQLALALKASAGRS